MERDPTGGAGAEPGLSGDRPLTDPTSDRLGYAPFAQRMAEGIVRLPSSEGLVIGLYGAWGVGKTTTLNYVVHYVRQHSGKNQPAILWFNPWWFSGKEGLVRAFFQQLQAHLGGLKYFSRRAVAKLGRLADLASDVEPRFKLLAKLGHVDTVPDLKHEISGILQRKGKRILVLIDDIDRLTPAEVWDVFRTVKAVADFPNVTYLMPFDRSVVIRSLDGFCGGNGENYLGKIIQVPFELPQADRLAIHSLFFERLDAILSGADPKHFDKSYWLNLFYEGISRFLETPRDVVRLTNALSITFRAVVGEVNPVDFVGIESLRLFCPEVYEAVRTNRDMVAGSAPTDWKKPTTADLKAFHDGWLNQLSAAKPTYLEAVKAMLKRLFPRLESVWGNTQYGSEWESRWTRDMRACSEDIFRIYFSFAVPRGDVCSSEIRTILAGAHDCAQFCETLSQLSKESRPDGKTRLSAFLDRVQDYTATEITIKDVEPILMAVFEIGDDLIVPGEMGLVGFSQVGNDLQLSRIVWQLLKRVDANKRFPILEKAFRHGRAVYLMQHAVVVLGQQQGKYPEQQADPAEKWLVSAEELPKLEGVVVEKARAAAGDGTLLRCPGLPWVLNLWRDGGNEAEAKNWVSEITKDDAGLVALLEKYLQTSASFSFDDAVGQIHDRLDPEWLQPYLDPDQVAARVEGLASSNGLTERQRRAVRQYLREHKFRKAGGNPNSPFGFHELTGDDS